MGIKICTAWNSKCFLKQLAPDRCFAEYFSYWGKRPILWYVFFNTFSFMISSFSGSPGKLSLYYLSNNLEDKRIFPLILNDQTKIKIKYAGEEVKVLKNKKRAAKFFSSLELRVIDTN